MCRRLDKPWVKRMEIQMSNSFVIEVGRRVVGLAVRCRRGFQFFASDPAYRPLERQVFRRARSLAHAVAEFKRPGIEAPAR